MTGTPNEGMHACLHLCERKRNMLSSTLIYHLLRYGLKTHIHLVRRQKHQDLNNAEAASTGPDRGPAERSERAGESMAIKLTACPHRVLSQRCHLLKLYP